MDSSGNLDERVSDRVLYDILIQAGRVVDLQIPRDEENKPKGFATAEYETEAIADYAVRLFTGLMSREESEDIDTSTTEANPRPSEQQDPEPNGRPKTAQNNHQEEEAQSLPRIKS
ncbi:hypothetical protein L2E82_19609 [Cichorium intybus]|uniref:Uncharacterized protein n=1 Tax=Cichorium intybus TaxID=13427 RepID=A0ACB9FDK2_CICIN|nr:hypothetical protein L2E82_19609 [Cichorium intybus]